MQPVEETFKIFINRIATLIEDFIDEKNNWGSTFDRKDLFNFQLEYEKCIISARDLFTLMEWHFPPIQDIQRLLILKERNG